MPPAKVLVVSPDARLREEIVQTMLRDGLIVDHVPHEAQALSACEEHRPPDFIVLDLPQEPTKDTLDRLEQACGPGGATLVLLTDREGPVKRLRGRRPSTIRIDRPDAISGLIRLSRLIERRYRSNPPQA
jgi:DNA-binding response OmpR family regulator